MNAPTFLDTNLIVYAINKDSPYYARATALMEAVGEGELEICLSLQVLGELYATATNPKKVEKALTPEEAVMVIEGLLRADTILKLYPKQETLRLTLDLVKRYQLKSLDFFDAQIVATMLDNGVTTIYTANEDDFAIFEEITAVNPFKRRIL
jgi:predicted nucleic acid-binding protein